VCYRFYEEAFEQQQSAAANEAPSDPIAGMMGGAEETELDGASAAADPMLPASKKRAVPGAGHGSGSLQVGERGIWTRSSRTHSVGRTAPLLCSCVLVHARMHACPPARIPSPPIPSHRLPTHRLPTHRLPTHRLPSHRLPSHRIS
jgi:hypothetical protein